MRTLIQNRDLKTLFSGVSIAAAAGLVMGAVMYPNLNAETIKGPQILTAGGGPRAEDQANVASVADYHGHVPDYVVGTDSLKPPQYQMLAYADRAQPEPETAETGEQGDVMAYEAPVEQIRPARWRDEPREPVRYPSQAGNTAYEVDLPAPPPPPSAIDEDPISG